MSLNNIKLGTQQLVQLYGSLLVETPGGTKAVPVKEKEPVPTFTPKPVDVNATAQPAPTPLPPAPAEEPVAAPAADAPFIRSLGGNARRVLVVVQREKEAFLPDSELKFLTSIMSACGLSLADIALVNLHAVTDKAYGPLTEHFGSKLVLLFDVTPAQLGMPINFPPFQVQTFKDCKWLHAPALHLIEADVTQKKNLWAALKNMFGI